MNRTLKAGAIVIYILLLQVGNALASPDVQSIIDNIEKNDKQAVRAGHVDSLFIKRGNAEFRLGPGELALYDFGCGRTAAMTYEGEGRFRYLPPDAVEADQLRKFTKSDMLDAQFKKAAFFFTVGLEGLPDSLSLGASTADISGWKLLKEARDEEFDHIWKNITNKLIGDLLSPGEGTYFNAYFSLNGVGDLVFEEDPFNEDLYTLYELVKASGSSPVDIISGYSPENDLTSQRGVVPIDITHYDISAKIEGGGKMTADCRIHFTPMRWGCRYIYFSWYYKNKIISVVDSRGDSLLWVRHIDKPGIFTYKTDEPGFGVILSSQMELGQPDSLDISYVCDGLDNIWGVFYMSSYGKSSWYPRNEIPDRATFNMTLDCPKSYETIASGNLIESKIEEGRLITKWEENTPILYPSFYMGVFDQKNFYPEGQTPVKVYISKNIPHKELALYLASLGELSSADMPGRVGADVCNSLAFYRSLFGKCPFDTIRVTEIPESYGMGTAGLINLAWSTFQMEHRGNDEILRAHEVAHQWWPHVVSSESYHDAWLMEGLAQYCGFWFFQMSTRDKGRCNDILEYYRQSIFSGAGVLSVGNKAGPISLGPRLTSSKSDDYATIVYYKGAYIFHMIRYLLHDYKTASDDAFAAFLKDLATKYKGRTITTSGLQKLLEEHAGLDMSWFFNQWVYSIDIPEYTFSSKTEQQSDGKYLVTCHIKQEKVSPDFKMLVPLTVLFADDKYVHIPVLIDGPEKDINLPLLPYKPKKIVFNTYDAVLCKVKYR